MNYDHQHSAVSRSKRVISRGVLPCALALAALAACASASAANINTVPSWNGTGFISSWGVVDTATYGQTIIPTVSQQTLTGFTFYLDPRASATNPQYQAFVYRWDAANSRITGSALYSSAILTAPSAAAFTAVTINTGSVALTPGQQYVLLFTTSTVSPQPGASSYSWGSLANNTTYSGGQFVYNNNGYTGAATLSTTAWSYIAEDLAFAATFAPTHVVETAVSNTGATAASGAAVTLDALLSSGATGDMQQILGILEGFSTDRQFATAAKQTLPLMSANMPHATLDALHGVNRVLQARSEGVSKADIVGKQTVWATPFGSWASQDNRDGISGYNADTYGVVVGLERYLTNNRYGVAFAYSDADIDDKDVSVKNTADLQAYQLAVYGAHLLGQTTDITWQLDYGRGETDGRRFIDFGGLARVAKADYNSEVFHAGLGIGRAYSLGDKTTITPSLKADYARIHSSGYTEKDADSLNLQVASNNTDELVFAFDGKLVHSISDRCLLTANLGFGYDAIDKQTSLLAAYQGGGSAFLTKGVDRSPWLFEGGLGLVFKVTDRFEVSGRYNAELRSSTSDQTGSLRFALLF